MDYSENVTIDDVVTVTVNRALTLWGRMRHIDDAYVQATVAMTAAGVPCTLDVRVYDSGYAARFSKVALSTYGGEIKDAVKIDLVDEGLTATYTLDGADPIVSETAAVYTAPITLTDSRQMRVAVKDTDGNEVATLSYRFNKIAAPIPSMCPKDHANPQNDAWLN